MTRAADVGAPSSRLTPGLLAALGYLSMAGSLSTDLYLPAFPDMAADLGISASAVQLTLTAFLIGAGLGQLTIGSISDALGRRRTLIVGLTLFVICCYLASMSPSLEFLALVRVLQGFAGASGTVLSRAIIADLTEREEAVKAFSILFAMIALGPALANPLGAWLTQVGGWRWALMGLAVLSTGMLVAAVLFVPESLPPEDRHPFRVSVLAGNIGRLARHRTYMLYAVAFAAGYASLLTYLSSSSFIVQDLLGLTPVGYSLTFAFGAVFIMIGSWGTGRIAHVFGAHGTLQLAQLVIVLSALAGLLVASFSQFTLISYLAVVAVFGIASGSIMATGSALAIGQAQRAAGAGSALLGCLQYLFGAVASPLGGILGRDTAVPAMASMAFFGVVALLSAAAAVRVRSRVS
ncbi:MAG: multidrug effflux MFS transporter [Intrasporangiaceae bacterium]|nr:multidrug effflux MFS transporter [Intrasporangiaceae bacterium]